MPQITWNNINNLEQGLSARNKVNTLGANVSTFSGQVVGALTVQGLFFLSTTVPTSAWVADTTYESYPFKAVASCNGVLATDTPFVMFSPTDQVSNTYIGADAVANGVVIYASSIPTSDVSIPNIIVLRNVNLN